MATQSQQKREALRSINDIRVNNEAPASLRGGINAIKSEKRERLFAVAAAAMTNAAASKASSRHRGSGSFTGSNLTDGDQSKWRNDGGGNLSTAEVVDETGKQRLATPSAHGDIHGRRAHLKVSTKEDGASFERRGTRSPAAPYSVASSTTSNSPVYVNSDIDSGRDVLASAGRRARKDGSGPHHDGGGGSGDEHEGVSSLLRNFSLDGEDVDDAESGGVAGDGNMNQDPSSSIDAEEGDGAFVGRSYAAQLRACMRQFHAARKRRRRPNQYAFDGDDPHDIDDHGGSYSGSAALGGSGAQGTASHVGEPTGDPSASAGRQDCSRSRNGKADGDEKKLHRSNTASFDYHFFHSGGDESIVSRLQRLQRSLSDGLQLGSDKYGVESFGPTNDDLCDDSSDDDPLDDDPRGIDRGGSSAFKTPGQVKSDGSLLEEYVWQHDDDDGSPRANGTGKPSSSSPSLKSSPLGVRQGIAASPPVLRGTPKPTSVRNHFIDVFDLDTGNEDDEGMASSPLAESYYRRGAASARRNHHRHHETPSTRKEADRDAVYVENDDDESTGDVDCQTNGIDTADNDGRFHESVRTPASANGSPGAAASTPCRDEGANDSDLFIYDDRAVTATVMKAKLINERLRAHAQSPNGNAAADGHGEHGASEWKTDRDVSPGSYSNGSGSIVKKLRAALERAAQTATTTSMKLTQVEEEHGVQQLLLHASMQRQAELMQQLEKAAETSAKMKDESMKMKCQLADAVCDLKKAQRDYQDEHSRLRSARAALAEMASQNARLVSGYSEKKGMLRKRQAEIDALVRERDLAMLKCGQLEQRVSSQKASSDVASAREATQRTDELRTMQSRWDSERAAMESKIRRLQQELEEERTTVRIAACGTGAETKQARSSSASPRKPSEGGGDDARRLQEENERLSERIRILEQDALVRERQAEEHQCYRQAEQHKSKGNSLFHSKKYQEAYDEYTLGIRASMRSSDASAAAGERDGDGGGSDPRLRAMLHSNRAAASQHLGRYCDAIVDCCIALEADAGYTRALQRRAEAFIAMQHYDGAYADLAKLAQLGDAEALASLPEAKRRARRSPELDHYAVLNLPANATNGQIKSSYRQLALRLHPDKAKTDGEKEAAECLFRHVAEAHRVLASPGKRRRFDAGKMLNRAFRSSSSAHHHHHR